MTPVLDLDLMAREAWQESQRSMQMLVVVLLAAAVAFVGAAVVIVRFLYA